MTELTEDRKDEMYLLSLIDKLESELRQNMDMQIGFQRAYEEKERLLKFCHEIRKSKGWKRPFFDEE